MIGHQEQVGGTETGAADSERRRVVQRGLWFDESETGVVYEHRPGRTVRKRPEGE